ncbi:hypothetical protein V2A60_004767 [Cordyceps javanica]
MLRLTCILATTSALAAHAAADDAIGREVRDPGQLFRGSSAESPGIDAFLFKRDRAHELAGVVSLPDLAWLGSLTARQQQQCPYPVMSPPLCCPSTSACRLEVNNCCPDTAVTCGGKLCAKEGSVCCGQTVCPAGTECNTNGGSVSCCRSGDLKCLGTCCPAGSRCAEIGGYCRRLTPSERTSTTETTTTTTTTTSRTTRATETTETSTRTTNIIVSSSSSSTRTTSTAGTSETACSANDAVARRGDQHDHATRKRQNLRPNCVYECRNGQRLPVVEVPDVPGQTDQLFLSMCSGILGTSSGRAGGGGGGDGRNFDVLTYRGADGKALRRSQARCKGYCAQQKAVFGDPATLQCDEYPPAMAGEGGKGAFRVCIPNAQNSGAQARLFRRFVSDCAPVKGKPFIVRMKGGCRVRNDKREADGGSPLQQQQQQQQQHTAARRADGSGQATTFNASSSVLYSWDNMTYMYVPLPELQDGHYRIAMQFRGEVRGVQVTDSDGDDHYASGATVSDGHVLEFDVTGVDAGADGADETDPLPAGLFLDVDEAVDVSYTAEAMLNSSTQTGQNSWASRAAGPSTLAWTFCGLASVVVVALA